MVAGPDGADVVGTTVVVVVAGGGGTVLVPVATVVGDGGSRRGVESLEHDERATTTAARPVTAEPRLPRLERLTHGVQQ